MSIEKSGTVKEDAFFTILKLHGMDLAESEKNRLKKGFSRANKISYNDALHSINIDLDSAVLNEEKWTVPEKASGAKAQEAQNSLMPGKAVSHLSRMSLAEFDERQGEMQREISNFGNAGNVAAPSRAGGSKAGGAAADQVSIAPSSVSKQV